MTNSPRRLAIAISILLLGVALVATAQTVREQVSVEVVTITIAARDRSGHAVRDLRNSDLSLLVDGKRVAVDTFAPESGIAVAVNATSAADPGTPAPSTPAASVTPTSVRTLETAIFVDEGETKSFDRRDVYDQLTSYLALPAAEPRRYFVARFSGSALTIECPWTSDPVLVQSAIARLRSHPRMERIATPAELPGTNTSIVELQSVQRHLYVALLETIASFPDGPARRQILFVSGGTVLESPLDLPKDVTNLPTAPADPTGSQRNRERYDASVNPAARASDAFVLWSVATGTERRGLLITDITSKAAEREIAIIPIAAEAFDRGMIPGVDTRNPSRSQPGDGWMSPGVGVGQAMSAVAEETGAQAILVPRRASTLLAARESERAGYTLTFRDPNAGDSGVHRVELVCARSGVKLDYRRKYRVPAPEERTLDRVVARFLDPRNSDDPLAVAASTAPATSMSGRSVTRLTFRFTPPREADPSEERDVSVIAVGQNGKGERTQPIRWTGTADAAPEPGTYVAALDLGAMPASFTWSLAVRDDSTGLVSFVTLKP